MKLTTAAQMRELDRQAIEERNIPSIELMERAAEGVAQAALDLLPRRPGKCGRRPSAARATTAATASPRPGCCF